MEGEVWVGEVELVLGGGHDGGRGQQLLEVILLLQQLVQAEGAGVEVLDDGVERILVAELGTHPGDRASNEGSRRFTIVPKKVPQFRNYHKGRAAIRHYANQTARPL